VSTTEESAVVVAVIGNVIDVAPSGTVASQGTVTPVARPWLSGSLVLSSTHAPPAGAGSFKVTTAFAVEPLQNGLVWTTIDVGAGGGGGGGAGQPTPEISGTGAHAVAPAEFIVQA